MEKSTSEAATLQPQLKQAASSNRTENLCEIIAKKDYIILPSATVRSLLSAEDADALDDWAEFQESWNRLEQDQFMKDGGTYRFRRHGVYSATPASGVQLEPPHLTTRASRPTPSTAGLPGISLPSNRRSRRARF